MRSVQARLGSSQILLLFITECDSLVTTMSQPTPNDIQSGPPGTARAYALSTVDEARTLYDEWAATYDQEIMDPNHKYVAPALSVTALLDQFKNDKQSGDGKSLKVLDAGCGTGLDAAELVKQSAALNLNLDLEIDGIDLSTGMMDVARRTGLYRSLETADMSQPLTSIQDQVYDAVICVGVLTEAHVRPIPALAELVRVVKSGGLIVATVKENVWEEYGYDKEIERLEEEGKVQVVSNKLEDSLAGKNIKMKLPVLKVM